VIQNSTIQTAVSQWVAAATGFGNGQILWAGQNAPRPSGAWVSLNFITYRPVGRDWIQILDNEDPEAEVGQEIIHRVLGVREAVLSIQVFAGPSGTAVGDTAPMAILENIVSVSYLPTRLEALNAAGIGIMGFEPIQNIGALLNPATFEPRAAVTCRMQFASKAEEFGTFIEFVELENETTEQSTYIPEDPNP